LIEQWLRLSDRLSALKLFRKSSGRC
jgi:hypothetical protein